jgi:hypothetical protein
MTDTTLAERLARCVKPLEWELHADDDGPRYRAFCPVLMCVHCADDEAICDSIDATRTARILAALDLDALAQEVEAMVGAERLPRLTEAMIVAACQAHYGKNATQIDGIALTVAGQDYSFREAFKRMWKGIAAAIRAREGGKP